MNLLREKTVAVNGAQVKVRSSSAWSMVDAETVRAKMIRAIGKEVKEGDVVFLRVSDIEASRLAQFVLMVVNTVEVSGDLGFEWPVASDPVEKLVEAYERLGETLNAIQLDDWTTAIRDVDLPPGDPDTFPGAKAGEAKSRKSP